MSGAQDLREANERAFRWMEAIAKKDDRIRALEAEIIRKDEALNQAQVDARVAQERADSIEKKANERIQKLDVWWKARVALEHQCDGYAGDPGASAPRCESYRGHPGGHFIKRAAERESGTAQGTGPQLIDGLEPLAATAARPPYVEHDCPNCGWPGAIRSGHAAVLHERIRDSAAKPAAFEAEVAERHGWKGRAIPLDVLRKVGQLEDVLGTNRMCANCTGGIHHGCAGILRCNCGCSFSRSYKVGERRQ